MENSCKHLYISEQ